MKLNLAKKIIKTHLVDGEMKAGNEIGIKVDQVLTQDATGTMAFLQFEAMNIKKIKVPLAVSYVDHNMLQVDFRNPDDHLYLQTAAAKYGAYFSKPGNGICHQVNLERFSKPGNILIGSDSHTPTSGGAGMIAIGVGGLDVAVAMGGGLFYFNMPKIVGVKLIGKLRPWVTAKDIILEMLRKLTVKGGVGKIIEYHGSGIKTLSVPERSTITNMGAELGATCSIFPSDERTKEYFQMQGRLKDWKKIEADKNAKYDEEIEINLNKLEPLIACPGAPDNIKKVKDVAGKKVQQVLIGSCTNSNYIELMRASEILDKKKIHSDISFGVNPGSRQVFQNVSHSGGIEKFIKAGARVNESACLGCIGMGQAPGTDWISVRSFNRNWPGRSGTVNDNVYLTSPETCIATAVFGKLTDPRKLGKYPNPKWPKKILIDDSMIISPNKNTKIVKGPNIKPLPKKKPLEKILKGEVLIKLGDNISTDAIMPAGAKILPLRSNIPAISEYVFTNVDKNFVERAKKKKGGFIIGGDNYGQGSSREHAALAPMYLGIKAVLTKSFARIHRSNLINFGILPLTFKNPDDHNKFKQGSKITIVSKDIDSDLVKVNVNGKIIECEHNLTDRNKKIIRAGGLLNFTRRNR